MQVQPTGRRLKKKNARMYLKSSKTTSTGTTKAGGPGCRRGGKNNKVLLGIEPKLLGWGIEYKSLKTERPNH
jgi:hypothetical protein